MGKDSSGDRICIARTLRRDLETSNLLCNSNSRQCPFPHFKADGYYETGCIWTFASFSSLHLAFLLKTDDSWEGFLAPGCAWVCIGCHSHSVVIQYWTLLHSGKPEWRNAHDVSISITFDSLGMDRNALPICFVLFFCYMCTRTCIYT